MEWKAGISLILFDYIMMMKMINLANNITGVFVYSKIFVFSNEAYKTEGATFFSCCCCFCYCFFFAPSKKFNYQQLWDFSWNTYPLDELFKKKSMKMIIWQWTHCMLEKLKRKIFVKDYLKSGFCVYEPNSP